MPNNTRRASTIPACFEALESRQFMSAAPLIATADWAVKAAPKAHLTVPLVNGDVFTGTATSKDGGATITLTISTESKSGKLTGTLVVVDGSGNGPQNFTFKGTVNKHNTFSLTCKTADKQTAILTGSFSADTKSISGRYVAHKPKHAANHGTFSASR